MAGDNQAEQNPVTKHPQPEFEQQDQAHPGWTGPMDPPPTTGRSLTGAAAFWRAARHW